DGIRAVFIEGSGKNFSNGGNLKWLGQMVESGRPGLAQNYWDEIAKLHQELTELAQHEVVVLTYGKRYVVGTGLGLWSDNTFGVATEDARFMAPEIKYLITNPGQTFRLTERFDTAILGLLDKSQSQRAFARYMALTGDFIRAPVAKSLG